MAIPLYTLISSHNKTNTSLPFLSHFVICPDKMAAVDESADAGAEMTEEEWNLRVAELNKHQVCLCNVKYLFFLLYNQSY